MLWLICCLLNAGAAAGLFALCVVVRVLGFPIDLPAVVGGTLIAALIATPLLGWIWAEVYVERHNRRIPPWYCKSCGYNLTGNRSGVCPECGSVVPQAAPGQVGS